MAATAGALAACNAIIGVTDVTLRQEEGNDRRDAASKPPDDDPVLPTEDAEAPPPEEKPWFALGFLHGCARRPSGAVYCWGDNSYGQLGDGLAFDAEGRLTRSNTPVRVPGIDDAVSIGAGNSHTCVVRQTGQVLCWGNNASGQLGTGSTETKSSKPTPVVGIDDAVQVVGGTLFSCALRKDRTVACWGANSAGQLGDDTTEERSVPAPVKQLSDVASLAAGRDHTCAVLVNGDVMCWGANADGQLGIGSTTNASLPTKLSGLSDIVQVASAARFSCARERGGRVYCWGSNAEGQLGNGSPNPAPNPSPILVPSLGDAIWIWAGFEHACAVKKGGTVVCWGRGVEGQLGIGKQPDGAVLSPVPTPTPVVGVPSASSVYTGGDRACALTTDDRAFCWGSNAFGQLGNGNFTRQFEASQMADFD